MHKGNAGRTRWPGTLSTSRKRNCSPLIPQAAAFARPEPSPRNVEGVCRFVRSAAENARFPFHRPTELMKPIVLVNAAAGTAVQFVGEELCAKIGRAFGDAGKPCEIRSVDPGGLNAALQSALRAERPVVVAGGDGSVSAAVQRFAGTGIPLGILPFGT